MKVLRWIKFVTHQVTLGRKLPRFARYTVGFQVYFCKITLALFHLSLKIRKSHGNAR